MSDIYTTLVSKFFFPLHEKIKGHGTVAKRKQLEATQWKTPAEIRSIQLTNLKSFLLNVQENVPYYNKLFKTLDFKPDEITTVDDLARLPLLTKSVIRENENSLRANNSKKLSKYNTGGSSGEPLIFYIGLDRKTHDVAAKWRATKWWDVDIGDRELVVWGSPVELNSQDKVKLARDSLFRSKLLPAFQMADKDIRHYVEEINRYRPKMLFGYPSSISLIAKYAKKHNLALPVDDIKVVFVTSEKLYPEQRKIIEEVFQCSVANGYGGRDAGFIAHECPSGGMHLSAEDLIVEIVDAEGRVLPIGEEGEIVVTNMSTKDFPFVRYKIGDVGILSDETCSCGRGLPLLKDVKGRTTDFIVASNGTIIHGLAFIYVLRDIPGVKEFKITQESLHHTKIEIVEETSLGDDVYAEIVKQFKERLGEDVKIDVECVSEIPREKSGKFRYVISKVDVS